MSRHKKLFKGTGGFQGFLPCLVISACILPVSVLAVAAILMSGAHSSTEIGIYSLAALIASALISGAVCTRTCGDEGRLRITLLCPFTVVLLMLLLSVIFGCTPSLSMLMNYVSYMGVFLLSAMIFKARGGKIRHKRIKR